MEREYCCQCKLIVVVFNLRSISYKLISFNVYCTLALSFTLILVVVVASPHSTRSHFTKHINGRHRILFDLKKK